MEAPHPFDAWTWVRPHRPAWVVSIARYIMRLCCSASQIVLNATRGPSSTIAACETARNNKRRAVAETAVDRTRARAGVVAGELPFPFIIEQIPGNATRRGGRREGDAADSTPCSLPVDLDRSTGWRGSHCAQPSLHRAIVGNHRRLRNCGIIPHAGVDVLCSKTCLVAPFSI